MKRDLIGVLYKISTSDDGIISLLFDANHGRSLWCRFMLYFRSGFIFDFSMDVARIPENTCEMFLQFKCWMIILECLLLNYIWNCFKLCHIQWSQWSASEYYWRCHKIKTATVLLATILVPIPQWNIKKH